MVVGKVSEFIGSLYYLCVTLLRFKNIMKLKNYLLLLALLRWYLWLCLFRFRL